jgi:hypothetical protein
MVTMTLAEAERIARERLPEEGPAVDELANWRRPAEPPKQPRGLDTAPVPQVDWSVVIHGALKAERGLLTEATGRAIGEVRDAVLDEVDAAIEKVRAEFRAETDRLRAEFSQARELGELRTQLAEIKTLLTARSRKPPPPQPPAAPANGDARSQQ